jgi:hypothetical protein
MGKVKRNKKAFVYFIEGYVFGLALYGLFRLILLLFGWCNGINP